MISIICSTRFFKAMVDGYIPGEDIINFLEIGREIENSRITEIKNLFLAPKSSLDCNNAIKIVSNKDTIEADTKENIKAENTENVVESITDLDIEYKLNGEVKKVEASRILAKSFNENELHSTGNFKSPEKKIINASGINISSTDIQFMKELLIHVTGVSINQLIKLI